MTALQPTTNDRIKSAIATIAIQALLGYALVTGLAVKMPDVIDNGLKLFRVMLPSPPPRKPVPPPAHGKQPEGAAAPPNLRAKPTEVAAPVPVVRIVQPPPVVIAVKPGIGADSAAGAADVRGPGTGSGGDGDGTGGGGNGDGAGGDDTPPRWRRGDLSNADFPASVLTRAGDFHGTVSVRYVVTANGRVTACAVTRSSGDADVDATTCHLIEKRFRFDPSRDAAGRPVAAMIVENHSWDIEHDRSAPPS